MRISPLQFARDFAHLKTDLAEQSFDDLKLLTLAGFWQKLAPLRANAEFSSYVDEYASMLEHYLTESNLQDLTIEELEALRVAAGELDLGSPVAIVVRRLITIYCWVGDIDNVLQLSGELTGETIDIAEITGRIDGHDSFKAVMALCDCLPHEAEKTSALLRQILDDWKAFQGGLHHDRANCLFVETGGLLPNRGRLRVLSGNVTASGMPSKQDNGPIDEVVFDSQVKSPDDPFIGVVYQSLEAVRSLLGRAGNGPKAITASLNARYAITDSNHSFTGDSIGLAASLVAYTQLLQPELLRHERFISSEVAFTGGVTAEGEITPVNESTLCLKITRAFFSPLRLLALPLGNLPTAEKCLNELQNEYPRRKLRLVADSNLSDVTDDLNIVRAEKVCMGQFVARKAYKYSRTARVQVPLLLVMLVIFIQLLFYQFPKLSPFFDDNPQYVKLNSNHNGFIVMNADSVELWDYSFQCGRLSPESQSKVYDLNNDSHNEVLLLPHSRGNVQCEDNVNLYVFDYKGSRLFKRLCSILNEYPGDTIIGQPYNTFPIEVARNKDKNIIITQAYKSSPPRSHFKFWDIEGNLLGTYINAGHGGGYDKTFLSNDSRSQFYFLVYNNPQQCVALLIINPDSSFGCSPPYDITGMVPSNFREGNQIAYILFPRTEISKELDALYSTPIRIVRESENIIQAVVQDHDSIQARLLFYLNEDHRVYRVVPNDVYTKKRRELIYGEIPQDTPDEIYYTDILNSVQYWKESRWVTEGELLESEKSSR